MLASPSQVFQILCEIENYQEWNPLIVAARGKVAAGENLSILIQPPGEKVQPYKVKVLSVIPNQEFVWLGHWKIKGLIDGMHFFELKSDGQTGTKLIHREEFRGILVPFLWKSFFLKKMLRGFLQLNEKLKIRAEQRSK